MRFPTPLIPGTLIRRYNRFLADIELEDGSEVTAHCPNPGSMLGLRTPGLRVWVEPNDDPNRKLKYGWRLIQLPTGAWVGIDTTLPNRIVAEGVAGGTFPTLAPYGTVRAEVKYGTGSRIDFLLSEPGLPDCYVEVKSVTLCREGDLAEFPDSVTARGAKHLQELAHRVEAGDRAVLLYLVQRTDCRRLSVAADLDPTYAAAFAEACAAGVEVLCYATQIDQHGISIAAPLPIEG